MKHVLGTYAFLAIDAQAKDIDILGELAESGGRAVGVGDHLKCAVFSGLGVGAVAFHAAAAGYRQEGKEEKGLHVQAPREGALDGNTLTSDGLGVQWRFLICGTIDRTVLFRHAC